MGTLERESSAFNSSSELFLHHLFDPSVVDPSFKKGNNDLEVDKHGHDTLFGGHNGFMANFSGGFKEHNLGNNPGSEGHFNWGSLVNDTEVYVLLTLATLFFTVFLVVLYLVSELMHKAIRGDNGRHVNNASVAAAPDTRASDTRAPDAARDSDFFSVLMPSDLSTLAHNVLSLPRFTRAAEGDDTLKRRDPPPPYDNPPPYTEAVDTDGHKGAGRYVLQEWP